MKKPEPQAVRPSDAIRRAYQRLTADFNKAPLTLPQTSVLRALMDRGIVNQTSLVAATGIDRSTLGEMLKRMASQGLVAAVRLESDNRNNLISLTPAGRKALLKSETALADAESSMMRMVPHADRQAFLRCLRAIVERA